MPVLKPEKELSPHQSCRWKKWKSQNKRFHEISDGIPVFSLRERTHPHHKMNFRSAHSSGKQQMGPLSFSQRQRNQLIFIFPLGNICQIARVATVSCKDFIQITNFPVSA